MAITRRRSHISFTCSNALLVIIICISFYKEMASSQAVPQDWWKNVCTPGDAYIERDWAGLLGCKPCSEWCRKQCEGMKSSVVKNLCRNTPEKRFWKDCQCCCRKPPSTPPSPPLPPATSTPEPFTPNGYSVDKICTPNQLYLEIQHIDGVGCALKPLCTEKCKERGRINEGNQCLGSCRNACRDGYKWVEQCCCSNAISSPPPPPSPSPPPPSPPPPPPSPPPPPPPSPSPPPPSPPPPPPSPPPPPPLPPPSPPPPSPSPPPPSPSPPPPSPPPPAPTINICNAGDAFIPTPTEDCKLCTADYCASKCSEIGRSLSKGGCAPSVRTCKCCCKSITLHSSSPAYVIGSSLFLAVEE